jgi:hypothetical protein
MIIEVSVCGLHYLRRDRSVSADAPAGISGAGFAHRDCRCLMTHKYRGSIVVLSISKSVEPNEEQKEMISPCFSMIHVGKGGHA